MTLDPYAVPPQQPAPHLAPAPGPVAVPGFRPEAMLRFVVQGGFWTNSFIPPRLTIDGFPAPLPMSGPREFMVERGRHRLQVHCQWMRRYGQAELDIDVAPGQVVEVCYAPPLHQFSTGSMGLTKQPRKGWVLFGVTMAIVVALFVVGVVGVVAVVTTRVGFMS